MKLPLPLDRICTGSPSGVSASKSLLFPGSNFSPKASAAKNLPGVLIQNPEGVHLLAAVSPLPAVRCERRSRALSAGSAPWAAAFASLERRMLRLDRRSKALKCKCELSYASKLLMPAVR